ncbi:MAG: Peptidoglycan-binding domain 1 protein [Xanthobacteraceae bacterium]|jgi:hypothetical protein|nr:Peptidoglycan-binding domain 1 protein [Xanthobacteraceae bacterium]
MPRSYASDLLVDDIDLDGERVAGRPYRPSRRRSDLFMIALAGAASAAVLFNALALQQGRSGGGRSSTVPTPAAAPADIRQVHNPAPVAPAAAPAPSTSQPAAATTPPAAAAPVAPLPPSKPAPPPRAAAPAPSVAAAVPVATPNIASLLPPGEVPVSQRIVEIQKALARLGYGPIRIDGRVGETTKQAIERFERDRRLPVTGEVSDRVIRELNAVAGLSIQ